LLDWVREKRKLIKAVSLNDLTEKREHGTIPMWSVDRKRGGSDKWGWYFKLGCVRSKRDSRSCRSRSKKGGSLVQDQHLKNYKLLTNGGKTGGKSKRLEGLRIYKTHGLLTGF